MAYKVLLVQKDLKQKEFLFQNKTEDVFLQPITHLQQSQQKAVENDAELNL